MRAYMFSLAMLSVVFVSNQAFAQFPCITESECFDACCPSGQATCTQLCRNSCIGNPLTCPAYYYFCKYNTFSADFNFLELVSHSADAETGEFVFYDDNGNALGDAADYTLSSLNRRDFDIHSVVGPNKVGQIIVSSNSEEDNISAAVSYYNSVTGGLLQTVSLACKAIRRVAE